MHDIDDVLAQAAAWKHAGLGVALATVVRTWGARHGRPRKLCVNERGEFVGSVSGGCIEGRGDHEALEVMAGGAPRVLAFGIADETAWSVGLACGGRVEVYVEAVRMKLAVLDQLTLARKAHRPVALLTWLDGSEQQLVSPPQAPAELAAAVGDALRTDQAVVVETARGNVLVEPHKTRRPASSSSERSTSPSRSRRWPRARGSR